MMLKQQSDERKKLKAQVELDRQNRFVAEINAGIEIANEPLDLNSFKTPGAV
jgi:hypothetical protein